MIRHSRFVERILLPFRFVHLEERALDEAEMPEGDFRVKYERIDILKAQMKAREAELAAMSPEERNAFIAKVRDPRQSPEPHPP